jgi:hypothetical protein
MRTLVIFPTVLILATAVSAAADGPSSRPKSKRPSMLSV